MIRSELGHESVLHDEVIEQLNINPDGYYVDGTYGRGGHARSILKLLGENGRLVVMDKDPDAVQAARDSIGGDERVTILHEDFADMSDCISALALSQKIDGILLDLGVSSPQLDDASRGFSFQKNGPLDMRMNTQQGETAAQWIENAEEAEISRVLWEYGEERFSRRIAKKIIESRAQNPIQDTATLAALISGCVPHARQKNQRKQKHPATRSFQAIRIHINRELEHITQVLESMFDILKIGGRLVVISFHSLEDRLVKRFFKSQSSPPAIPRRLPIRDIDIESNIRLKVIGKAIKAGIEEISINPRARSAVLRIAERTF